MATHSPFLLSIEGAKIYNFDSEDIPVSHWSKLENVRTYFDFFKSHTTSLEES